METIESVFSRDHDRLDDLFKEFQTLKRQDFRQAKVRFAEFADGLERHIGWEEALLFPLFEEAVGMREAGPTAVMRLEHRRIRNLLEEIRDRLDAGEVPGDEVERGLIEWLTAHNQKEEQVLYPWIDRTLSEAERMGLLERMRRSPAEAAGAASLST